MKLFVRGSCCRALQFTLKCLSRDDAKYKISENSSREEIYNLEMQSWRTNKTKGGGLLFKSGSLLQPIVNR